MRRFPIRLVWLLAAAWTAPAQTPAAMEPMLARIATYEYGQSRETLAAFTEFVQESMGSPELVRQIEARLLRFLQSQATAAAKDFALRELSLIATNASIPVLAQMLVRGETAEMARYALARIPGPAADEAFRKALEQAGGRIKVGIVNSLGQRRDAKSVPALTTLAASADSAIAEAARAALNEIAHPGGGSAAGEPRMARITALSDLADSQGKDAVPALAAAIESDDARLQAAAIRFLNRIPGPDITDALVRAFPKIDAPGQVRLLTALADRGDAAARPLAVSAAANQSARVRAAALKALGALGDSSSVILLAKAAATEGAEQTAARQSLYGLRGPGIDSAIAAAIRSTTGGVRTELIVAAGERGTAAAAGALIRTAREPDGDVRRESLRALRNVASPAQVPALLDLLSAAASAQDRREAAQALASVLRRSKPAPSEAVISAYEAASSLETRLSLIEVLGNSFNEDSLTVLRSGLKDPSPEIVRAAILALTGWDSPAPIADLLAFARGSSGPALQILALRGYLNLVALPSSRPAPESARMLAEGMRLAREPAEKQSILALLARFPCQESLDVAKAALSDDTVAKEARAAADKIETALKRR